MHEISAVKSPALGDIRESGYGDTIYVHEDAATRKDWPRIWNAVGTAFVRGARVVPLVEGV